MLISTAIFLMCLAFWLGIICGVLKDDCEGLSYSIMWLFVALTFGSGAIRLYQWWIK